MNQHHSESEVAGVLRQASDEYGDLPADVGNRLDRVLNTLPAADTLRSGARQTWFERWAERLRPKRVRYAILSTAAAVLFTVGGVSVAIQVVGGDSGEGESALSSDSYEEHQSDEGGAAPEAAPDEEPMNEETQLEEPGAAIAGVETFATGVDYADDPDLIASLHELGATTRSGEVPPELEALAAGGRAWEDCEEAITAEYGGLLIAVDFAHYDAAPAMVALLLADSGEVAIALTPACAEGLVEPLAVQP
ncbi:hypothetical protein AB0B28_15560 [Glycomyces sp. NPDC046736]|uniref:hypothetical protein n=1 Tax=Glycomyces sp. NPDC046736 TaxID=3155615 RepID=UPI0033F36590